MTHPRNQPPEPAFNVARHLVAGAELERQMRHAPELRAPPLPPDPSPFAGHYERHIRNCLDLSLSQERMGAIDAARARQTALQAWLEERRVLFSGAGMDADLIGVEWLQITHRSCGGYWLVVPGTMPELRCPYCTRGGR